MKQITLTKDQLGQIGAGVLFTALFIYFYFSYFWLPLGKKIEEKSRKVAQIEADISNAKAQKAKYKDLEAKLASLRQEKDAAEKKLPREKKFPDLIRTITDLSKKHNVKVGNISPAGEAQVEYFKRVSYNLTVRGNYHDVGRFLAALGLLERILTSENVNVNGTPGAETSAEVTFTLVAYQYNG
jgi:type IV pilus assembly protein PilO